MKKLKTGFVVLFCCLSFTAGAETRFEAITFKPAPEGGDYFSVHESKTLKAWEGQMGLFLDYANRPMQFTGEGSLAGQRQSIIDHMITVNTLGAIGFTDWWTVGINIPVVAHNWYYSDNPTTDPTADEDFGADMADIEVSMKFNLLNADEHKVGFAFVPQITLPTGNPEKYTGNGVVTGGGSLVVDVKPVQRLSLALNVGAIFREGFTRTYTFNLGGGGSSTDSFRVNDQLTYGAAANYKFTPDFHGILEAYGATTMDDFFADRVSPFEAGGGIRYYFRDAGFALAAGGTLGILDGIGKPRFRTFVGFNWYSPENDKECPVCQEAPKIETRIVENKIVLWGKIFYDTNKDTIKPISYPVLDDVVDVIQSNPDIKLVEVQGHTDARASDAYNLALSQRRAQSAVNYLVEKGIAPERLVPVGYGESQPIADNKTEMGMSQNRRTEFIIKETHSGKMINSKPSKNDEKSSDASESAQ